MSESKEKKSKLKSVKFWVVLWAMLIITLIVVTKQAEFKDIALALVSVPLAYIPSNVWQKKIVSDSDKADA